MESIERLSERLDNLQAVVPMLEALRLVALGSWQAAKKQGHIVSRYTTELNGLLPFLLPHLPPTQSIGAQDAPQVILLIGAERGLVGRFLDQLLEFYAKQVGDSSHPHQLILLGTRLERLAQKQGMEAEQVKALPTSGLPPWQLAIELADGWWSSFQAGQIRGVSIVHQATRGGLATQPIRQQLLPLASLQDETGRELWPPPIIETNPQQLAREVLQHRLRTALYTTLLRATEAEQLTRYQLLEAAVQNADRLREELITQRQNAQQQAITQEMQELVVGAGMLGSQDFDSELGEEFSS